MLKQRVLTALLLLALLVPAVLADSPWPFIALTLLAIGAAGWEWARLNGCSGLAAGYSGVAVAALCALALAIGLLAHVPVWIWRAGALLWLVGGALALRAGPLVWPRINKPMRMLLGIVGLTLAWLALVSAHALGVNFLMSLLCLVWMADIAAYFGGRRFGRRKLALSISPGKSWEGAWSGLAGVLVLALLWLAVDRQSSLDSASLFTLLMQRFGPAGMLASVFLLVGFSVVGDLFESLVKRAAGVKDSSGLLPGHGGVLDRVDALLPVLPLAMALITL